MERKRKALITQSVFSSIGGSEVQAIELAQFLVKHGWSVVLYSWLVESPLKDIIDSMGLRVLDRNDPEALNLRVQDFDLLWIQHQVIPESILMSMASPDAYNTKVVFSHMSPYREVHIEQPYTYNLEQSCGDLILFNAESTKDALSSWYPHDSKQLAIYPNPAPEGFAEHKSNSSHDRLSNILIVSNHAPIELEEAAQILSNEGVKVDHLSDSKFSNTKITTPEILEKYDCVITIGKTVQYCLVQSIPVYIYDRFGGPGYLSDKNFDITAYYNFSGRCDPDEYSLSTALHNAEDARMTAIELAHSIMSGFEQARTFLQKHHTEFVNRYLITNVIKSIVQKLNNTAKKKIYWTDEYLHFLIHNQRMISEYVVAHHRLSNPAGEFYRQEITKFSASGNVFGTDTLQKVGMLQQRPHLQLSISPGENVRIDFGERPCLITDLRVVPDRQLVVHSNATYQYENTMFFYHPDPQIVFTLKNQSNGNTSFSIEASVYPLSEIPESVIGNLVHSYLSSMNKISDIQQSRWWKLHEFMIPRKTD